MARRFSPDREGAGISLAGRVPILRRGRAHRVEDQVVTHSTPTPVRGAVEDEERATGRAVHHADLLREPFGMKDDVEESDIGAGEGEVAAAVNPRRRQVCGGHDLVGLSVQDGRIEAQVLEGTDVLRGHAVNDGVDDGATKVRDHDLLEELKEERLLGEGRDDGKGREERRVGEVRSGMRPCRFGVCRRSLGAAAWWRTRRSRTAVGGKGERAQGGSHRDEGRES